MGEHVGRRGPRLRLWLIAGTLALVALTFGALGASGDLWWHNDNPWPYAQSADAPILAAVGDISCQPTNPVEGEKQKDVCDKTGKGSTERWEAQTATANQIEAMKPNLVALLGDEQYEVGRYSDFLGSFDHTYGAFKFLQRPSPGNHEFYTSHGQTGVHGDGYFDYYNGAQLTPTGSFVNDTFAAEPPFTGTITEPRPRQNGQAGEYGAHGNGWYSYDLGDWHIVSLNVECAVQPGGCNPSGEWFSSETKWLAEDLQSDHAQCTMAYWHQPTFSPTVTPFTSDSEEGAAADSWWKLLYAHHADLILNGHDHVYARFAPMNPSGQADYKHGIREFVIGTGGESLDTIIPSTPNLEASADWYYGTMKFTLDGNGYQWDYQSAMRGPEAPEGTPASYSDMGSGRCHGGGGGDDGNDH
jgi:Calcineurin-like phosphoesterase